MKYTLLPIFILFIILSSGCVQNTADITPFDLAPNKKQEKTIYQYHRNYLNEDKKKIYDAIYYGAATLEKEILLSCNEQTLSEIVLMICNDHPELFWLNTKYEYSIVKEGVLFYPDYSYTSEEIAEIQTSVDQEIQSIMKTVQSLNTDYEKVLFLYDWIIDETEYIDKTKNNQNMISVLLDRQAVCAGYSEALKYLLDLLGIPNGIILVKAKENADEFHVINLVQLDQEWYYFDPTFGDIKVDKDFEVYRYTYFGMTSTEIEKIYIPQQKYIQTQAYKNNYFYKNNRYLDTYNEADFTSLLQDAVVNNEPCIAIKCSDAKEYSLIKNIIQSNQIFDFFHAINYYPNKIQYYLADETNSIFFSYK